MSRKVKTEEKNFIGTRTEILQVADIVARDKGIDRDEILEAMEEAILKSAQLKYGTDKNIAARINRKNGDIELLRTFEIVFEVNDPEKEISLKAARSTNPEAEIGGTVEERLPNIDFGRVSIQLARQVLVQRVQMAEHNKQIKEFKERVGDMISGVVKRAEFQNVILDVGHAEGILKKFDLLPNENFNIGDRVKAYLYALNDDASMPLLQLSRTHSGFLKKLFEQEVPEIYSGTVKIMGVAREPGSKAKMAVFSSDSTLDPIGACVGIKGARVQAVVDELKGEKIDIVLWDDNTASFIVNSLAPAEVKRLVMEESGNRVDVVVPTNQLSGAIGRRGQNVRLASKLTGWTISVITEEQDAAYRTAETTRLVKLLMGALDVDEMVAHLLIGEGYCLVEDLANVSLEELSVIEGFDEDIASEIINRAKSYLEAKRLSIDKLCQEKNVQRDLIECGLIRSELLEMLINSDIKNLDDLGALSSDELIDITENSLSRKEAEALIMNIRGKWFGGSKKIDA
ncbi:transcription termination/antitermination protein NusA [Alphaproteobacteria bacterium]|nr:transcription termination/antitermination protein NusA [Alphaproteobacteria bacterium]